VQIYNNKLVRIAFNEDKNALKKGEKSDVLHEK